MGLALLAAIVCAGLCGCSDPGVVTAQVYLQRAPASESEVLATIPRGGAVKVRNCTNGWCSVSWNGRDGYILTKDVRIGSSAPLAADIQNDDNVPGPDAAAPP